MRHHRIPCVLLILAVLVACATPLLARNDDGAQTLNYRVRDVFTGVALPGAAAIAYDEAETVRAPAERTLIDSARADRGGYVSIRPMASGLAASATRVEFSADGYRTLGFRPNPGFARHFSDGIVDVWLEPRERTEEMRIESIRARQVDGMAMIHGHVVDVETGRPLAGAVARLATDGAIATTDTRGYFELHAPGAWGPKEKPALDDLVIAAPGFRTVRLDRVQLVASDMHFVVDMEPGVGPDIVRVITEDETPNFVEAKRGGHHDDAHEQVVDDVLDDALDPDSPLLKTLIGDPSSFVTGDKPVHNPPDTLQVNGYGAVATEVYVANGLCAEWLSWFPDHSRDAGAIAYRTYAAEYVLRWGSICTSTSCQVFNNSYVAQCDQSARRTAGILLELNGVLGKSEYSSENNVNLCGYPCPNSDPSCGWGNVGAPNDGWPCLPDVHSWDGWYDDCCFGHGRGMCQFGTYAHANTGRTWNWITDFYYNNHGAGWGKRAMYMTTPIDIAAASLSTSSVAAGGSFTINATLRSYADWDHPHLLLGATIEGPGSYNDAPNDKPVTAFARIGSSTQWRDTAASRSFTVPGAAVSGTYDVVVSVWYDVDGDGTVSAVDEPLKGFMLDNALTVGGGGPGPGPGPCTGVAVSVANAGFETTSGGQYSSIPSWGPSGSWASHAAHSQPGNGGLGGSFGFYSANTSETVGQVLGERFAANTTYSFSSWAIGGANHMGAVPYQIGYANLDGNLGSFVELETAVSPVTDQSAWAAQSGVTHAVGGSGSEIGKQIIVRFGSNTAGGQSDIWIDSVLVTKCSAPASIALANAGIETTAGSQYSGIPSWGPSGGWAHHAAHSQPGNGSLGGSFGFYSANTSETVGQVLTTRFESGKTYTFKSWAIGGANHKGAIPYQIGYASIDGNLGSFVELKTTVSTVTGQTAWAEQSGVTYSASGAAIGKQIIIRLGPNTAGGQSDIWFDELSLTVQ
ncbi:MAG: SpoIID/LytB domain-containing protein [Acidobacteriota bacterium]